MNFRKSIFAANRFGMLFAGLTICSAASFAQAPAPALNPRGAPLRVAGSPWNPKSIAYIKASNARNFSQLGFTVAISGDGNTMAVTSTAEDKQREGD